MVSVEVGLGWAKVRWKMWKSRIDGEPSQKRPAAAEPWAVRIRWHPRSVCRERGLGRQAQAKPDRYTCYPVKDSEGVHRSGMEEVDSSASVATVGRTWTGALG